MSDTTADNGKICPKCGLKQEVAEICAGCGLVFAKYRPPLSSKTVTTISSSAAQKEQPAPPSSFTIFDETPAEEKSRFDMLNIITLLMLIDSTLILIAKVPGLSGVFSGPAGFHQRSKFLYDIITAAGIFASAFGLLMKKEWARLSMTVLLALGLAEGLYTLAYLQFTVSGFDKELQDIGAEIKRNSRGKWIGCAIYAYFIYFLCSAKVRARFRPPKIVEEA
jgi:hypothetical protein